jgi:hypothetical protein
MFQLTCFLKCVLIEGWFSGTSYRRTVWFTNFLKINAFVLINIDLGKCHILAARMHRGMKWFLYVPWLQIRFTLGFMN